MGVCREPMVSRTQQCCTLETCYNSPPHHPDLAWWPLSRNRTAKAPVLPDPICMASMQTAQACLVGSDIWVQLLGNQAWTFWARHGGSKAALPKWRQEDQEFKVILGYMENLRPAWVPNLTSLEWLTVTWKHKPNDAPSPLSCLWIFYHGNRNKTRMIC